MKNRRRPANWVKQAEDGPGPFTVQEFLFLIKISIPEIQVNLNPAQIWMENSKFKKSSRGTLS